MPVMGVELLSRMIGELILEHDAVSLPGLGTFVAEDMPASFSDRGYTINPPYRRMSFTQRESSDGLLAALLAERSELDAAEAQSALGVMLAELGDALRKSRSVDLPGLGRLRATRENHFFFVPDDDLDISPESCGLESVSLKTHSAVPLPELDYMDIPVAKPLETPADAAETAPASAVETAPEAAPVQPAEESPVEQQTLEAEAIESQPLADLQPAADPEPAAVAEPVSEAAPAPQPESPAARRPRRRLSSGARWTIGVSATVLLLLGAFTAVSRLVPGSTDRLLYTQEELQILNYPEDGLGLPR